MKSLTLYAIIDRKAPKLTYFNLLQTCDKKEVRLKKGEKIIKVTVVESK